MVPENPKAQYPYCVKSAGKAPKQYKQKLIEKLKEEVEKGEIDDKIPDEVAYKKVSEEKLVFDEEEGHDLEEDENGIVATDEEDELGEREEGEDEEMGSEHEEQEGDEKW